MELWFALKPKQDGAGVRHSHSPAEILKGNQSNQMGPASEEDAPIDRLKGVGPFNLTASWLVRIAGSGEQSRRKTERGREHLVRLVRFSAFQEGV